MDAWRDLRAGCLLGIASFVGPMRPLLPDAPLDPEVLRREPDAATPSLEKPFAGVRGRTTRNTLVDETVHRHRCKLRDAGSSSGCISRL
jgi:hypothetical protein